MPNFKFPPISEDERVLREQRTAENIEWFRVNLGDEAARRSRPPPNPVILLYPADEDVNPVTTPEDILWLARKLLEWEGVREVLERVGEHGDFTEEEEAFVDEVLAYVARPFRQPGHYSDNLNIAVVLARRFISGSVSENDDKAAQEFAADRIRTFTSPNWPDADVRPPKISELLQILENLKTNRPEIIAWIKEVHEMPKDDPRRKDITVVDLGVSGIIIVEARKKYGLTNRNSGGFHKLESVMARYAWGFGIADLKRESVLAELREMHMTFRDKQELIDDV